MMLIVNKEEMENAEAKELFGLSMEPAEERVKSWLSKSVSFSASFESILENYSEQPDSDYELRIVQEEYNSVPRKHKNSGRNTSRSRRQRSRSVKTGLDKYFVASDDAEDSSLASDSDVLSSSNHYKVYSKAECKSILQYLVENEFYPFVKGNFIWQQMEKEKVCARTWQNMKTQFQKYIYPHLEEFALETSVKNRFVEAMEHSLPKKNRTYLEPGQRGWRKNCKFYSFMEDALILYYVLEKHRYQYAHGNSMWKRMELKSVIPGRSWHSLKSRYKKFLTKYIDKFVSKNRRSVKFIGPIERTKLLNKFQLDYLVQMAVLKGSTPKSSKEVIKRLKSLGFEFAVLPVPGNSANKNEIEDIKCCAYAMVQQLSKKVEHLMQSSQENIQNENVMQTEDMQTDETMQTENTIFPPILISENFVQSVLAENIYTIKATTVFQSAMSVPYCVNNENNVDWKKKAPASAEMQKFNNFEILENKQHYAGTSKSVECEIDEQCVKAKNIIFASNNGLKETDSVICKENGPSSDGTQTDDSTCQPNVDATFSNTPVNLNNCKVNHKVQMPNQSSLKVDVILTCTSDILVTTYKDKHTKSNRVKKVSKSNTSTKDDDTPTCAIFPCNNHETLNSKLNPSHYLTYTVKDSSTAGLGLVIPENNNLEENAPLEVQMQCDEPVYVANKETQDVGNANNPQVIATDDEDKSDIQTNKSVISTSRSSPSNTLLDSHLDQDVSVDSSTDTCNTDISTSVKDMVKCDSQNMDNANNSVFLCLSENSSSSSISEKVLMAELAGCAKAYKKTYEQASIDVFTSDSEEEEVKLSLRLSTDDSDNENRS